jgi:non-specific serine/threonine protein kinase/serine/threonine-protein kinase
MSTNREREQQIELISHAALARDNGERDTFIKQACAGDPELQNEVKARIAMLEKTQAYQLTNNSQTFVTGDNPNLESTTQLFSDAATMGLTEEEQSSLFIEPTVGQYRIIRILGQGGMGTVYLAHRADEQYKKKVAIKVVRFGLDTEFVIKRFRNERQILASLDHPNIARLLDGGATQDGRPYFVMEYVEGKPITEYADDHRLSTVERLKLFRKVCSAVHYAHQNLVIHRDIKPGNILVTADGVPKLLDFGIAKLLNPELADQPIEATIAAVRLMTPEYASPEQAKGEPVTTASDIYSLGVLLYQLLTGHRPYRFANRSPEDMAQVICQQNPERPSTAINRSETVLTSDGSSFEITPEQVSKSRDGNLDKLRKRLAGDIDNIVLMAMRKEPERRYSSVDQFSNDIRRHLEGSPVIARQDTFGYRTSKFIRRNKAAMGAALLILVTLIAGIITTTIEARRADRRFNDVRRLANSFLFEFHDAIADLPGSTPARELVVKRALEYLDSLAQESGSDPSLQRELATAYQKVGDVQGNPQLGNLGDMEGAISSFNKSLAIREKLLAANPTGREDRRAIAELYSRLGNVAYWKGDLPHTMENHAKAVAIEERLLAENPDDVEGLRNLRVSYTRTAYAQAQAGDFKGGFEILKKASTVNEKIVAIDPTNPEALTDMAQNYSSMGEALGEMKDLDRAIDLFGKALKIYEDQYKANPNNVEYYVRVAGAYTNLGESYALKNNFPTAIEYLRKALAICEELAKADPQNTRYQYAIASLLMNIGSAQKAEHPKEALETFRKSKAVVEKIIPPDKSNMFGRAELAYALKEIGVLLAQQGDQAGALENCSRARELTEELADANPTNAELKAFRASSYTYQGQAYAALASSKTLSADKQLALLGEARTWLQKGFEIYDELRKAGIWTPAQHGSAADAAQELAKCEAAIAKLQAAK